MRKILYDAVVSYKNRTESRINLENDKGWMGSVDWSDATMFTLNPIDGANLPVVSVCLDGDAPRRVVFFSRVLGRMMNDGSELVLKELARLYCVGWQSTIEGKNVKCLNWIYPTGAVICADEPPFVNELIEAQVKALEASQVGG